MALKKSRNRARTISMPESPPQKTGEQVFKLGDLVKIRHSGWRRGRVVELRGPLGPNGSQVYRVLVRRKPKPAYIELREDQLEIASPRT